MVNRLADMDAVAMNVESSAPAHVVACVVSRLPINSAILGYMSCSVCRCHGWRGSDLGW